MGIENIEIPSNTKIAREDESETPKISDRKMEMAVRHLDTFMGLLADVAQPRYSLGELADILEEPEFQIEKMSLTNRKHINRAVRGIQLKFPNYPDISTAARKVIIDWAEQTQRQDTRRLLQLATLAHAVRCHTKLMRIVPKDRLDLQHIQENFIRTCWWTALWQDLVQAHGNQLPTFFIFE